MVLSIRRSSTDNAILNAKAVDEPVKLLDARELFLLALPTRANGGSVQYNIMGCVAWITRGATVKKKEWIRSGESLAVSGSNTN